MSDDLRRKLRMLEGDYFGQPLVARRADLRDINQLRAQLKMPLVDDHLNEIGVAVAEDVGAPEPEDVPDHAEAREIYRAYFKKHEELELHRAYAERVAKATSGNGQTPVRPLATMGTNGGALLCDHCEKPIVLEGGHFQGVAADVASGPARTLFAWISRGFSTRCGQKKGIFDLQFAKTPGFQALECALALGQMTAEWQARGAAVNTSTTPKVQYNYTEMSGGANHSRLTSVTYPDQCLCVLNAA